MIFNVLIGLHELTVRTIQTDSNSTCKNVQSCTNLSVSMGVKVKMRCNGENVV